MATGANAQSSFSNDPLEATDLPALSEQDYVPIDPKYLRVSLAGSLLFAAIVLVAAVVIAVLVPRNSWVPLGVGAVLLALTGLASIAKVFEVRHIAYQVRERDLSYRSGVLVRTVATIPFVRVQHARIRQGPVERRFGLATLDVNSAGPDLQIHGLAIEEAERLKLLVVERAGDLDEDG